MEKTMLTALLTLLGVAVYVAQIIATVQFGGAAAWALAFTSAFIALIFVGVIGDMLHNKKVRAKKAEFRLPWYYRWEGWQLGHMKESGRYLHGLDFVNWRVWDPCRDKLVNIHHFFPMERPPRNS